MNKLYHHTSAPLVLAAAAAMFSLLAITGGLIYRTYWTTQFQRQSTMNCEAIENLKAAIREVFHESRARARANPRLDPDVIERYYNRQLERFAPQRCINGKEN